MKHLLNSLILILIFAGCDYAPPDPCAPGSPLANSFSEDELDEMCEGETGEEPEDVGPWSCDTQGRYCDVSIQWGGPWPFTEQSTCPTKSAPLPCFGGIGRVNEHECFLCDAPGQIEVVEKTTTSNAGWAMCQLDNIYAPNAVVYKPAEVFINGDDWIEGLTCTYGTSYAGRCGIGPALLGYEVVNVPGPGQVMNMVDRPIWTCECDDDDDCQIGAVCESGWVQDGLHFQPTMCGWGDNPLVGGPVVYGLDRWDDGITIIDDLILIDPIMYLSLAVGIMNDDIMIGLDGQLEEVGPTSLAAHVGLEVGDTLTLEDWHQEALEAGEPVTVAVVSDQGLSRWITVVLD